MIVLDINSYSCSTEVISGSFERQLVLGTKEEAVNISSVLFLSLFKYKNKYRGCNDLTVASNFDCTNTKTLLLEI